MKKTAALVAIAIAGLFVWGSSCTQELQPRDNPYDPNVDGGGNGGGDGDPPAAPQNVQAVAGNSRVTITWDAVTGAAGYRMYYRDDGDDPSKSSGTPIPGAASPYAHAGLNNGTTYRYCVTATNSYGESMESSVAEATPDRYLELPGSPPTVNSSPGIEMIGLFWTDISNASGYYVWWMTNDDATNGYAIAVGTNAYDHTGLRAGVQHCYRIVSTNGLGQGGQPQSSCATPLAPPVVTNYVYEQEITGGSLNIPEQLVLGPAGEYLYVTELNDREISRYGTNGSYIGSFGVYGDDPGELNAPWGLAVVPGPGFYVTATVGSNRIDSFTNWDAFEHRVHVGEPRGLAVDVGRNRLYVSLYLNDRIDVYDLDLSFIESWTAGNPNGPCGLAVDPVTGDLYVACREGNTIAVYDPTGATKLGKIGTGTTNADDLYYPEGVTIGPDRHVYVADFWSDRVKKFDLNWNFVCFIGAGILSRPTGIAVDGAGRVWVGEGTVGGGLHRFLPAN